MKKALRGKIEAYFTWWKKSLDTQMASMRGNWTVDPSTARRL